MKASKILELCSGDVHLAAQTLVTGLTEKAYKAVATRLGVSTQKDMIDHYEYLFKKIKTPPPALAPLKSVYEAQSKKVD